LRRASALFVLAFILVLVSGSVHKNVEQHKPYLERKNRKEKAMTHKKMTYTLDPEEQEILDAFEKGEVTRSKNVEEEIRTAQEAARNYFKKDARINIRLSSFDLNRIKKIASLEGLPYQTFIASILHKYANNVLGSA
jgi:predicted DNA binding CopG/RHH family protein